MDLSKPIYEAYGNIKSNIDKVKGIVPTKPDPIQPEVHPIQPQPTLQELLQTKVLFDYLSANSPLPPAVMLPLNMRRKDEK